MFYLISFYHLFYFILFNLKYFLCHHNAFPPFVFSILASLLFSFLHTFYGSQYSTPIVWLSSICFSSFRFLYFSISAFSFFAHLLRLSIFNSYCLVVIHLLFLLSFFLFYHLCFFLFCTTKKKSFFELLKCCFLFNYKTK